MSSRFSTPRSTGLFLLALGLIVAPLAGLSVYALHAFERSLLPQLDQKILAVGAAVEARLERALGYGIPLERLPGVAEFFDTVLDAAPDLAYLAVTRPEGAVLFQRGTAPTADALARATARVLESPALFRESVMALEPPQTARRLDAFHNLTWPLDADGTVMGVLHVGADARFVARQLQEILFDIVIVFLIAVLVAFELLPLIAHQTLIDPLRRLEDALRRIAAGDLRQTLIARRDAIGRLTDALNRLVERLNAASRHLQDQFVQLAAAAPAASPRLAANQARLGQGFQLASDGRPTAQRPAQLLGARMATFLFIFAAELSQPFLPLYIRDFAAALNDPPSQTLIGLPLVTFTLVAALSMPVAGWRFERAGCRRTFGEGALLLLVGLIGAGLAQSYLVLLGWRALAAVGYAFLYVACQGYVIARADPRQRAGSGALFVSGIMAASICGPAIGGILADRIGYTATFFCAAALAALAAATAHALLDDTTTGTSSARRAARGLVGALVCNPRFALLMLCAAIPAKLLLNGFLFFLAPLALSAFGDSHSEIGRILMLYGLAALFLGPTLARLADRFELHGLLVGAGGLLAGLGLIPVFFFPTSGGVVVGVLLLGIGQAMSISPQLALATRICQAQIERFGQGPVLGCYRLVERLGGAAGPLVAAGLAGLLGYPGAITVTGILAVSTATLFSVGFLILGVEPEPDDEPPPAAS